MFEKASRLKIRYQTSRGAITVEDLWDVPLVDASGFSLDAIARGLSKQLKEEGEESFITPTNKNYKLETAFEIVKHVIKTKLEEIDKLNILAENKKRQGKLLAIIEKKQDAALENLSIEELKEMMEK